MRVMGEKDKAPSAPGSIAAEDAAVPDPDAGCRPLNFWDVPLPMLRKSGRREEVPSSEILSRHDSDPVVAVLLGHPLAEMGWRDAMAKFMQGGLRLENDDDFVDFWLEPDAGRFKADVVDRYYGISWIHGSSRRMLQIDPPKTRDGEGANAKPGPGGDDCDDKLLPIGSLCPDFPTREARKNNEEFFAKSGTLRQVNPLVALCLMIAAADVVPGGGGHMEGAIKPGCIRVFGRGGTLFRDLLCHVLSPGDKVLAGHPIPAPADERFAPWLDERVHALPPGKSDVAQRTVPAADRHAAGFVMNRRYRLGRAEDGVCDLTGLRGPVVSEFLRLPNGLKYLSDGWTPPNVATVVEWIKEGEAVVEKARYCPQSSGPLRFDDWLDLVLAMADDEVPPPTFKGTTKVVLPPPIVRSLRARCDALAAQSLRSRGPTTSLGGRNPVGITAINLYMLPEGKTVAGMSMRAIPVYAGLDRAGAGEFARAVRDLVLGVAELGDLLRGFANDAAKAGRPPKTKPKVGDRLKDGYLLALSDVVDDAVARLARLADEDEAARETGRRREQDAVAKIARKALIDAFDAEFPIVATDPRGRAIAATRAKFRKAVFTRTGALMLPKPTDARPGEAPETDTGPASGGLSAGVGADLDLGMEALGGMETSKETTA